MERIIWRHLLAIEERHVRRIGIERGDRKEAQVLSEAGLRSGTRSKWQQRRCLVQLHPAVLSGGNGDAADFDGVSPSRWWVLRGGLNFCTYYRKSWDRWIVLVVIDYHFYLIHELTLLLGQVMDAMATPIVGVFADRTGRRKLWHLVGKDSYFKFLWRYSANKFKIVVL